MCVVQDFSKGHTRLELKKSQCPAGYTGVNCSQKCTMPTYGVLCGGICNCSSCHHEVGCISTPEFTGNDCPAGYFGNGCTQKCVLPSFGRACSDTCNCSFCHHFNTSHKLICDPSITEAPEEVSESQNEKIIVSAVKGISLKCTVGYTGVNCSQKCVLPTYGVLCSRICNCSYCNHGMGCISTPSFTECPIGYIGVNCSDTCTPPFFGNLCSFRCECLKCHHINGCVTECPNGYIGVNCSHPCNPPLYGNLCSLSCECVKCHHIYGCVTDNTMSEQNVTTRALRNLRNLKIVVDERHTATVENQLEPIAKGIHLNALDDL
uniref:Multiple epidermal growth factor-like domains 6 n=1 Tax=Magallana gigas TaxID=29159 RepID=K1PJV1_MAGGI